MDLSIVIVSYKMHRELPRTLLSLCPPYQRGMDGIDYEIIVVENSETAPALSVDTAGVTLRSVRPDSITPSPVPAANAGLAAARGKVVGVWIDGARLASPGLLRGALDASKRASRAVVGTLNHQLGSVRQVMASKNGYNQQAEDDLLHSISWPGDGYRLFEISTPEMKKPDGPMLESNAIFMSHALWAETGGFDPAFDEPGGGFANPDMFYRAVHTQGAQLVRLMGEGTFHQFHGGVTTSDPDRAVTELVASAKVYKRLRGHPPMSVREVGLLHPSPFNPAD